MAHSILSFLLVKEYVEYFGHFEKKFPVTGSFVEFCRHSEVRFSY